jgi:hypothetical protein
MSTTETGAKVYRHACIVHINDQPVGDVPPLPSGGVRAR